jgi:hypothetical protein
VSRRVTAGRVQRGFRSPCLANFDFSFPSLDFYFFLRSSIYACWTKPPTCKTHISGDFHAFLFSRWCFCLPLAFTMGSEPLFYPPAQKKRLPSFSPLVGGPPYPTRLLNCTQRRNRIQTGSNGRHLGLWLQRIGGDKGAHRLRHGYGGTGVDSGGKQIWLSC